MGQTKPVTVYRFLSAGTLEEKVYHLQAKSGRVVDQSSLSQEDTDDLYTYSDQGRPTPLKTPKDELLKELLNGRKDWIDGFHEHGPLPESKSEEEQTEANR